MRVQRLVALLLFANAPAFAQTDPAAAFGALEGVTSFTSSPDGKSIAFIAPSQGSGNQLFVRGVTEGSSLRRILAASGKPERLSYCFWLEPTRLACEITGIERVGQGAYAFTTVLAVDADGSNQRVLSARHASDARAYDARGGFIIDRFSAQPGNVLMVRSYVAQGTTGSAIEKSSEGLGVDAIDTRTGKFERIERPQKEALGYISDGHGTVRIKATDYAPDAVAKTRKMKTMYRLAGSREWLPLSVYDTVTREGFNPDVVDKDENVAFGTELINSRLALVKYSLDQTPVRSIIAHRDDADVDSVSYIGLKQRPVSVTFTTPTNPTFYVGDKLAAIASKIRIALGGRVDVRVMDESEDHKLLTLWVGGEDDPTRYFLYDSATKRLTPVVAARPALSAGASGATETISFKARDGANLSAKIVFPSGATRRALPMVVIPSSFSLPTDDYSYDWVSHFFTSRGFVVLKPDYRGSFGKAPLPEKPGLKGWQTVVNDTVDAVGFMISTGVADRDRIAGFGWSSGAHAVLQMATVEPKVFKAMVAVNPITDFATLGRTDTNFRNVYTDNGRLGPAADFNASSPAQNAGKFQAPLLLFHGAENVASALAQSQLMNAKMKAAGKSSELIVYPTVGSALDDAAARADVPRRSDAFLRTAMGIK